MGSAFHQLCPRYSGTLTPTTAYRLWETFTFFMLSVTSLECLTQAIPMRWHKPTSIFAHERIFQINISTSHFGWLVGWLVLGLTALSDNISVYIGPSPKEREKERK